MKLTKMPNPRKSCNPYEVEQSYVDTTPLSTPLSSPAQGTSLFNRDSTTGDNFDVNISYGGAASPVKLKTPVATSPLPVPNGSAQYEWRLFSKRQQDCKYNKKLPSKKPRNA